MSIAMDTVKRKCVVWAGPQRIELVEYKYPKLEPGSILLKVHACAICGSDLRIYKNGNPRITAPQVIGHEIAGEIVAVADNVDKFSVGDRVAVGADVPCGECTHCKQGRGNCCDINYAIGYQFEGGFAEYMLLNSLVVQHGPIKKFSKTLDYEVAALAEPLGCCINGYERGLIKPNSTVVIFGAGPIGIMLAMLAPVYQSKQVILFDVNQNRLDLAKQLVSVQAFNSTEVDPVATVMELTNNQGAEMIFTACPIAETHEQAVQMVSTRGVVNFFGGLPKTEPNISISSNWLHYREAYLTGSHGSTPEQHAKALELIESGKVDVKPLITHRYNIKDIKQAFDMALSGKALKVVIQPHV